MKKITLTNATVIPFYKNNPNDEDEIVRVIRPQEGSDFKSNIVSFNVETKVLDNSESKARLFEKCTIYAKNDDQINNIMGTIKNGAIVELEGYEKRTKAKNDNKYYTNIIVKTITPISGGVQPAYEQAETMRAPTVAPTPISDIPSQQFNDDDLPF